MRERWFLMQGAQRRGPYSLAELVEATRGEPDPHAVLVWRKGLRDWTLAEAVPELQQHLAAIGLPPAAPAAVPSLAETPRERPASSSWRALFVVALVAALGAIGFLPLLRTSLSAPGTDGPRSKVPSAPAVATRQPGAGSSSAAAPAPAQSGLSPAADARAVTRATVPAAADVRPRSPEASGLAVAATEAELPDVELARLRGVAAWSGDVLELTVYNATAWRVTELSVRVERLNGDDFVPDKRPLVLTPPAGRVQGGVADLLQRVAPDRKRPGLNALDTGVFEAKAGAAPEGFRWSLLTARGYPPQH